MRAENRRRKHSGDHAEESELNDNYNGATYLDTMKASAVDDYLASTHDKYHKELKMLSVDIFTGRIPTE